MNPNQEMQRSSSWSSTTPTDTSDDNGTAPFFSGVSSTSSTTGYSLTQTRRKTLPHPMVGDDVKLSDFLKKNIGKDLSRVTFPISFNEPLSLLQRMAEEVEYAELLDRAVAASDPIERIALVTAFAISGYACTKYRPGRKPFNPMLGETFEDRRTKFIAEKCSHHPPVLACHAEGDGWQYWATIEAKNSFTGKSLKVEPIGWSHVKIGNDHYRWDKPSSFVRNVIMGNNKFFEHVGPMTLENERTQMSVEVEFKEKSFWSRKDANAISATILSPQDETLGHMEGTWDHEILLSVTTSPTPSQIWTVTPYPPHPRHYYGFTEFALSLNEITDMEGVHLPPTDSRLRPDQRLMEQGKLKEAEAEKNRLEEAQRDRRARGADRAPRWFRKVGNNVQGEGEEWEYIGGYWEAKERPCIDEGEPLW